MNELPLLHITGTAAQVTTLDPSVAGAAALAMLAAMGLIWRDALRALVRRRGQRDLAMRIAALAVALAILPAVLPYDHLFFEHRVVSEAEEATHSMHCHLTPATCSDVPIAAGPGQFIFGDPLILAAAMMVVAIYLGVRTLQGRSPEPDLRPPII